MTRVRLEGRLYGATPWARNAITDELRAEVEPLIPAGHYVAMFANRRPGIWSVILMPAAERMSDRRAVARRDGVPTARIAYRVAQMAAEVAA